MGKDGCGGGSDENRSLIPYKYKVAIEDLAKFVEIQENLAGLEHDDIQIEMFKLYLKVKAYVK